MIYTHIISHDKIKAEHVLIGEAQYLERMRSFMTFEFSSCGSAGSSKQPLSEQYARKIPKDSLVFILDEEGKSLNSLQFSNFLREKIDLGTNRFAFLIGPAEGFDNATKSLGDIKWSLSSLTFPHQLCRLLVVEQLYRAISIIKGHPYHKV